MKNKMENENEYLEIILNFMKEAGEIALKYQQNLSANIKKDESIVTKTDITISKLFHERINKFLKLKNHKILDEENLPDINELFKSNTEYLWTIDPIDGTTTYYHGFPLWAIGISLYKNFEPYISAIYLPAEKELVYTDNKKSYFVKNVFEKNEEKNILISETKEITKKSIILQHKLQNFDNMKYITLDLYSSYVLGFYTLTNRSIGCFFNKPMKLWDISATLPIARNLGLSFKDAKQNKEITKLDNNLIDNDWYLNSVYLMCNKENYENIKSIVY